MKTNILVATMSAIALQCFAAMPQLEGFRYGNESAPTGNEWDPARDVNCVKNLALNKEMPRAWFTSFGDLDSAKKILPEYSEYWRSLNGEWKFHWAKNPDERPKDFFLKKPSQLSNWDNIPVPSSWNIVGVQKDGTYKYGLPIYCNQPVIFEHHVRVDDWKLGVMREPKNKNRTTYIYRNEVGSYLREFDVPANWDGREIFINFDGVDSFFYLWVNGKYVGFSKNSRDPACFDISKFVKPGEKATVAVEVYRNSDGSFLEAQDMFRLPGIFRTVSIYSTPKLHIRDMIAIPHGNTMNVSLDVRNLGKSIPKGCKITCSLYAQKALYSDEYSEAPVASATLSVPEIKSGENIELPKLALSVKNPKQWSAELPNLYVLVAELKDSSGKTLEAIPAQVGFCEVEIRSNQVDEFGKRGRYLYVNDKTVKLKGVNRHESHPARGHAITREDMEEEVKLMKLGNINHVRCSHYPDDPYFYFLCNKYGIYLEDEANIESHQYYYGNESLSHPEEWRPAHVARVMEMAHRNVNQPAIVIWSLGNEAGPGKNFVHAYNALKSFDKSRPVQYERNNNIVDMGSNQYPPVGWVQSAAKGNCKQPFHISEYAHSMGNAMGNLKDYWDAIESSNYICGGAIWDWVDQAMYNYDSKSGKKYLAYGGQFGDIPNDRDFVCNGIIFADRSLKPQFYEVKKVYQHIAIAPVNPSAGTVEIFNKYYFKTLDDYGIRWTLTEDGKKVESGEIEIDTLAPRSKKIVKIPYKTKTSSSAEYFLNVEFYQKNPTPWADAGYVQAAEQILVKAAGTRPAINTLTQGTKPKISENPSQVSISGKNYSMTFSNETGTLSSLIYNGKTIIADSNAGPRLDAFRAPTSNDGWAKGAWYQNGLNNLQHSVTGKPLVVTNPDGSVAISYQILSKGQNGFAFNTHQIWTIYGDGSIELQANITASNARLDLPRLGYLMNVPAEFSTFSYYGRGPIENYADRKSGQFIIRTKTTVADQFVHYIKPHEMGNREDVRWCALTDSKGKAGAIFIATNGKFSAQALPVTAQELDKASNPFKLDDAIANSKTTKLFIGAGVRGLGGSSCGPDTLDRDKVFSKPTQFGFIIRPITDKLSKLANVSAAGATPLEITRNYSGAVTISSDKKDAEIWYAINNGKAQKYTQSIPLKNGGNISAWLKNSPKLKTSIQFPKLDKVRMSVIFCSSQEGSDPADNITDNNPNTIWHTAYSVTVANYPHWIDFDIGEKKTIKGISYLPRQNGENGDIKDFEVYTSLDGKNWSAKPALKATFPRVKKEHRVMFPKPIETRYIRFKALSSQNGQDFASGAEFSVLEN